MTDAGPPLAVLLDTCAAIWLVERRAMARAAVEAIRLAGVADGVFVSPFSALEIGRLSRPRAPGGASLQFLPDPKTWFARLMELAPIRRAPFTADIAIDSAYLPGELHRDPGDRVLIATARHMGVPIVTRDARILAYAASGHVQAIAC